MKLQYTEDTTEAFVNIENSIKVVTNKVQHDSTAIDEMIVVAKDILNTVSLDEEKVESVVESSAVTVEQLATTEEISRSAQVLAELVENLQELMPQFKVENRI